jgi:hypothetical protein
MPVGGEGGRCSVDKHTVNVAHIGDSKERRDEAFLEIPTVRSMFGAFRPSVVNLGGLLWWAGLVSI